MEYRVREQEDTDNKIFALDLPLSLCSLVIPATERLMMLEYWRSYIVL